MVSTSANVMLYASFQEFTPTVYSIPSRAVSGLLLYGEQSSYDFDAAPFFCLLLTYTALFFR
jgi:hypothetical protein